MTIFLRLLANSAKKEGLAELSYAARTAKTDSRIFQVDPEIFRKLPGTSFAYWVDSSIRRAFTSLVEFESKTTGLVAKRGVNSNDDFLFLRIWWEVDVRSERWVSHPKGGGYSPYYADVSLVVDWHPKGRHLSAERVTDRVYSHAIVPSKELYFRPGLTWSLRTKSRLSMRVMPSGCVFGSKGPAVIEQDNDHEKLLAILAICSSRAFYSLIEVQLAAADANVGGAAHSFEVGVIQRTPVPEVTSDQQSALSSLARRAWSILRCQDTVEETSHAFLLPEALRPRLQGWSERSTREDELRNLEADINAIASKLYDFPEIDRTGTQVDSPSAEDATENDDPDDDRDGDEEELVASIDLITSLLSWAVGVAFGRFDWHLATGERAAAPEPAPFDPLPAISAGMLPEDVEPFHPHDGILVDDPGHKHDLGRLIDEVLTRVDAPIPSGVRRWLQREFFPFHLQHYSKSRRKAPIYWPLATASGGYTLWLYYPDLTTQTLYTAVNEFVEPKLEQVSKELAALLNKGSARSRDDDKAMEALQTLEKELAELHDTLLQIAPTYRPNHDDGVQITAAPLWQLFRHKPWQKLLKETWAKLEKGDYDWSHLAMAYWPARVREKCSSDKSLAIAHGLEVLYEQPPESATGPGRGGRKRRGAAP
jgi:hypothetical protein